MKHVRHDVLGHLHDLSALAVAAEFVSGSRDAGFQSTAQCVKMATPKRRNQAVIKKQFDEGFSRRIRIMDPIALCANSLHDALKCLETLSQGLLLAPMPVMLVRCQEFRLRARVLRRPKENQRRLHGLCVKQLGIDTDDRRHVPTQGNPMSWLFGRWL